MADRKVIVDRTMSALGLATAAAIVFLAPMSVASSSEAGEDGLVDASGSWTDLERGPAMAIQRANDGTVSR